MQAYSSVLRFDATIRAQSLGTQDRKIAGYDIDTRVGMTLSL
jgi:hypothetical protein